MKTKGKAGQSDKSDMSDRSDKSETRHLDQPTKDRAMHSRSATRRPTLAERSRLPWLLCPLLCTLCSALNTSAAIVTGLVYQVSYDLPLTTKLTFTPTNVVTLTTPPGHAPGLQFGTPVTISITNGVIGPFKLDAGDYLISAPLLNYRKPVAISVWQTDQTLDLTNFLTTPLYYGRVSPPPNNFIQYEENGTRICPILIEP